MTDYAELMTTFALFQGYTSRGTTTLIERGQIRECTPGEVLFSQGDKADCVLLVLTGAVEQYVVAFGRDIKIGASGPNHVIADVQALSGMAYPASARATDGTVLLAWDSQAFQRLVAIDTLFSHRVISQTAQALADQAASLIACLAALKDGN